ncbi:chemotaxis protein CheW [Azospirillum halopraeferens]|uniref:chemotaxis protein CheW n=1 Tax=Azospirillum halopraeferens TaxID=34010 RepID=UPI00042181DC|nr:chemotaxis protein CheW [Azospirillum halopraeferens]
MSDAGRIDWEALRRRLARGRAAFHDAVAGRGPWAEDLLDRRTAELARRPDDEADAAPRVRLLLGRGATGRYALEVRHVSRVQPVVRWTPVPGAPSHLLGLITVAGRVLRLFDTDRLCGAPPGLDGIPGGFAVLLRGHRKAPVALRLRGVEAVEELRADRLRPRQGDGSAYVKALGDDGLVLLDAEAIVKELDGD